MQSIVLILVVQLKLHWTKSSQKLLSDSKPWQAWKLDFPVSSYSYLEYLHVYPDNQNWRAGLTFWGGNYTLIQRLMSVTFVYSKRNELAKTAMQKF